eukprot:scaffold736_cov295-Prasinococcus_capsulatus_cf.AAC.1
MAAATTTPLTDSTLGLPRARGGGAAACGPRRHAAAAAAAAAAGSGASGGGVIGWLGWTAQEEDGADQPRRRHHGPGLRLLRLRPPRGCYSHCAGESSDSTRRQHRPRQQAGRQAASEPAPGGKEKRREEKKMLPALRGCKPVGAAPPFRGRCLQLAAPAATATSAVHAAASQGRREGVLSAGREGRFPAPRRAVTAAASPVGCKRIVVSRVAGAARRMRRPLPLEGVAP